MASLPSTEKQITRFKQQFLQLNLAGIEDWLDTAHLQQTFDASAEEVPHPLRDRVWTPQVTLLAFIKQALSDGSCSDAVKAVQAEQIRNGQLPCSGNTSAYCQARQKLPESLPRNWLRYTGERLESASRTHWRWRGRPVKLADGSTLTLPDTPENQASYPQEANQKPGLGFPILRIEIVASLNSAGVLDAGVAPYSGKETGETALFRRLMDTTLQPGDLCLTDQYYDSFWTVAALQARGVDLLCPVRGSRHVDWREGLPLKGDTCDRAVEWQKPARPAWMTPEVYRAVPARLRVRLFRLYGRSYVTTLLDSRRYRKNALRKLYRLRWQIEIDLRFIKRVLKMDPLRCKTPAMARKEISVFLLAYNLLRLFMLQAGIRYAFWPCRISFREALGTFREFACDLAHATDKGLADTVEKVLHIVASKTIGGRNGRTEPRALKRRHAKRYPYLNKPRRLAQQAIIDKQKSYQAQIHTNPIQQKIKNRTKLT